MNSATRHNPTSRRAFSHLGLTFLAAGIGLFLAGCGGDGADMGGADADTATDASGMDPDTQTVTVADAGLATPESVLHDAEADVYLVSNINGSPVEKDSNGFISRVAPDGTVEELRWIDGATDGVTLHAPKGMAIHGDTLFVSDIDSVRAFGRTTGEYHGARGVPGATFLNDLTVGTDGTLYVSDSGLNPDFSSSGTDAVYRFDGEEAVAVARSTDLNGPNGIIAHDGVLTVVSFGAPEVRRIELGTRSAEDGEDAGDDDGTGAGEVIATLPGGQLDGVVRLDDGSFLVSSWETESIYRVRVPGNAEGGDAEPEAVAEGVPSPADIGWDAQRRRVLIPVFTEDRLEFRTVR